MLFSEKSVIESDQIHPEWEKYFLMVVTNSKQPGSEIVGVCPLK